MHPGKPAGEGKSLISGFSTRECMTRAARRGEECRNWSIDWRSVSSGAGCAELLNGEEDIILCARYPEFRELSRIPCSVSRYPVV